MIKNIFLIEIITRFLVLFSFAAIIVSFSEYWFYEVTSDVNSLGIVLFYGILCYFTLILSQKYNVSNWNSFFILAFILGLIIEGTIVYYLYTGLPFTILWTSLAWHALLSVGVGWYVYHKIMSKGSLSLVILLNIIIGICLGLWNSYSFNASETDISGEVLFTNIISSNVFAEQFMFGFILFILGHFIFERVYSNNFKFKSYDFWIFLIIILVISSINLVLFFPFTLILPILIYLCILSFNKNFNITNKEFIQEENKTKITLVRYGFSILLPLSAIITYDLMISNQIFIEMNAILIVIAGPISLFLLGKSFYSIFLNKK